MSTFHIGSKAPRTRRQQQQQIFAIARSYELTSDDLTTIASEILGRTVDSISQESGFSDIEMFVLWCVMRGTSAVNTARLYSGNLDKLADKLRELDDDVLSHDDESWLNL